MQSVTETFNPTSMGRAIARQCTRTHTGLVSRSGLLLVREPSSREDGRPGPGS